MTYPQQYGMPTPPGAVPMSPVMGYPAPGYGAPTDPAQQYGMPPQPQGYPPAAQAPQNYGPPASAQPAPVSLGEQEDTSSLMSNAPFISFADRATMNVQRGGIVVKKEVSQQTHIQTGEPLFWDQAKTKPKMQLVATLKTAERTDPTDDGLRRLFIKGYMQNDVSAAVKAAGSNDLELGGLLLVAWTSEQAPKTAGFNNAKRYTCVYQRPGTFDPSPFESPAQHAEPPAAAPVQQPVPAAAQPPAGYPAPSAQPVQQFAPPAAQPVQQFVPQAVPQAPPSAAPALPPGTNPFGG